MKTVNIHEAKTQLSKLVERAAQGGVVELVKGRLDAAGVDQEDAGLELQLTQGEDPAVDQRHAAIQQLRLGQGNHRHKQNYQ